jgi:hypothetical protein
LSKREINDTEGALAVSTGLVLGIALNPIIGAAMAAATLLPSYLVKEADTEKI